VAALVLLGIAVAAAVLGVVTLFTGGDGPDQGGAPPQPSPPASTPGQPTGQPPSPTGQQPPPPGQTPPAQPPPPAPPPDPKANPVRVYNNGTVRGLATQAAGDFRAGGWNVTEVDNYKEGIIPTTTVYFRPGTEEEAAARELAKAFGMRAEPRFPGIAGAPPGLIVIITNDYGGK
jgi:hypothetical protein